MKQTLFCILALGAAAIGAYAENPRSITPTAAGLRQFGRTFADVGAVVTPTPAEAPENAVEVPFTHQLGKNSPDKDFIVANYTLINANGDGRSWKLCAVNDYSACMAPEASKDIEVNDDWLITMPVHMAAGNYKVSFDLGFMGSGATGVSMEVKLGKTPTAEDMTAEIVPATTFTEKNTTTYEYNCAIPEDGYWYIGFHCITTKAQKGAVKLYNIGVAAGEVVNIDPPAAGELSWVLAPKGGLSATVTYVAPTKTKSGADLTEITKVEITSRWGVDKFTYEDVAPGQTITIEDVEMYQGFNNRFTGVAYVGEKAGDMVEYKSIFCGKDTPLAPANVRLESKDDYSGAVLSWDAVGETGENGGYVDPEAVTYYIFDAFGNYTDPAIGQTSATTATLNFPELQGQDFVAYQVTAGYEENYSTETSSNIVVVGTPDAMPFTESFGNGIYEGVWCLDPHTSASGQQYGTVNDNYFSSLIDPDDPEAPEPLTSFDGDNGFWYWLPMDKDVMVGLMSVRTDISQAGAPVLEFRYQGQGSTIDVLVAAGKGDLEIVKSIDLAAEPTEGWTVARIPLSEYKAAGAVSFEIRLTATHNDDAHVWSVPLDYVTVRDLADTDLRIVSASTSAARTAPGETVTLKARVHNQGLLAADSRVELNINDVTVDTKELGVMAPDSFGDVEFAYTVPYDAPDELSVRMTAVAAGDNLTDNNDAVCTIAVQYPSFPGISALNGSANDDGTEVTLQWNAPVFDTPEPRQIFEDFENPSYTPMSISGCGGWTVHDVDKARTINVFYELYNPYQTAPMAFQLFNRVAAQVTENYWQDAEPHSGDSFMLAPTAYYDDNDNWLVSPELSGRAQTISFWAKSFSIAWPEAFEVRYSTGGNGLADFPDGNILSVENYPANGEVPETWTLFKVALPEGAKHFAIRHTGYYTCALYIDDISYEGMPELPADLAVEGYHIMRDGVMLTEAPVNGTSYTDTLPDEGAGEFSYNYTVLPVFNHGVGRGETVSVSVMRSGIESVTVDNADASDRYYNLQGIEVPADRLGTGVYIRVRNGVSTKLTVR